MTTRPETCAHASTTTLLWLYGEGPEDHVHHVATCEACAQVAAEHADVVSAVAPIAEGLAVGPEVPAPGASLGTAAPPASPANRGWWVGVAIGLAAAAALLLALVGMFGVPGASVPVARSPVQAPAPSVDPDPLPPQQGVAQDAPRQVAPLDDVEPELMIHDVDPETEVPDGRLAEVLSDDSFYAPLDDELDDLIDEFAALEADLTTL